MDKIAVLILCYNESQTIVKSGFRLEKRTSGSCYLCFRENKRPFHNFGNTVARSIIKHLFSFGIYDIRHAADLGEIFSDHEENPFNQISHLLDIGKYTDGKRVVQNVIELFFQFFELFHISAFDQNFSVLWLLSCG